MRKEFFFKISWLTCRYQPACLREDDPKHQLTSFQPSIITYLTRSVDNNKQKPSYNHVCKGTYMFLNLPTYLHMLISKYHPSIFHAHSLPLSLSIFASKHTKKNPNTDVDTYVPCDAQILVDQPQQDIQSCTFLQQQTISYSSKLIICWIHFSLFKTLNQSMTFSLRMVQTCAVVVVQETQLSPSREPRFESSQQKLF